jgi:hypothetical protein
MLVSGMIIGSLFTLFVVPSIYMLVARKRAAVSSVDLDEINGDSSAFIPSRAEGSAV